MVPDVGARLTWLGKEGSVPEPLAVQTCPIHLQVSQQRAGAAWEGASLRPRSLTLLQENALGKRRLLQLGTERAVSQGLQQAGTKQRENICLGQEQVAAGK